MLPVRKFKGENKIMFKTSVLVAFFVISLVFAVNAQDAEAAGGRTVTVPSAQYPTIESALYQGNEIVLLPGHYYGNFPIFSDESFRAKHPGTVTIESADPLQGVFAAYDSFMLARMKFTGITIISHQPLTFYYTAAIYGWGNVSIEVKDCTIVSPSIGISASYLKSLTVVNTKFIGTSNDAIGIYTSFNQPLGKDQGARIYDNHFESLNVGIHIRDFTGTQGTTVSLCKNSRNCVDSNSYENVATPIYQDQADF